MPSISAFLFCFFFFFLLLRLNRGTSWPLSIRFNIYTIIITTTLISNKIVNYVKIAYANKCIIKSSTLINFQHTKCKKKNLQKLFTFMYVDCWVMLKIFFFYYFLSAIRRIFIVQHFYKHGVIFIFIFSFLLGTSKCKHLIDSHLEFIAMNYVQRPSLSFLLQTTILNQTYTTHLHKHSNECK